MNQLRVAFISYEYAGLAKGGGIGTYVRNAAAMLAGRGHDVEVFTEGEPGVTDAESVRVHTVATASREAFAAWPSSPSLARAIARIPFDVVEAAEYGADGRGHGESISRPPTRRQTPYPAVPHQRDQPPVRAW